MISPKYSLLTQVQPWLRAAKVFWFFPVLSVVAIASVAAPPKKTVPAPTLEAGFDKQVRADFFMGFKGDAEALARGMAACEKRLKEKPDHPHALVWHGSGLMVMAGQQFGKGDVKNGIQSWVTSLQEMDRAVALAPNEIGVRVPRAAVMMAASRQAPKDQQTALLTRAVSDFEAVYKQQERKLARLPPHSRGELLLGLAESYLRSGQTQKGQAMLYLTQKLCPDTVYSTEATQWLAADKDMKYFHNCVGCHEG